MIIKLNLAKRVKRSGLKLNEEDKCMGERSGLWVLLIERNEMGEGREGEIRPYCPF